MTRILVTGARGQVGRELLGMTPPSGFSVQACSRDDLDITDREGVKRLFAAVRPQVVINTAAYTKVRDAEQETEVAMAVNRDGAAILAQACADIGAFLIHFSTDYVFDGKIERPYLETDPPNPLNVYGASKLAGEREIAAALSRHAILRTSWVFGGHGHNFVRIMFDLGKTEKMISTVNDQWGGPTPAAALAQAAMEIARQVSLNADTPGEEPLCGIFHFCGDEAVNWHGFAKAIFDLAEPYLGHKVDLAEVTSVERGDPTPRPLNSRLDCKKIRDTFGITQPSWRAALPEVVKKIAAS